MAGKKVLKSEEERIREECADVMRRQRASYGDFRTREEALRDMASQQIQSIDRMVESLLERPQRSIAVEHDYREVHILSKEEWIESLRQSAEFYKQWLCYG